jgi:hypothetical protein
MNQQFNPEGLHPISFDPNNGCNVLPEIFLKQVEENIRRQLPQAYPHAPNNETVALVCGGPSLAKTEKELVEAYWAGAKVVAVNGAYQWCIDRNIRPSAMVMLDARQFNSRFVEKPIPGCKYMLASQCHPDAFDLCKDRDVLIWHCCSGGDDEYEMLKKYYFDRVFPIGEGTTVTIKSIGLLCMLGFKSFDIFGFDSCWLDDAHHGYSQKENDRDKRIAVWLRPPGRDDLACRFECAPWMMQQASDFQKLVNKHGDEFRLNIRGDGLIAATMRLSAIIGSEMTLEEEV